MNNLTFLTRLYVQMEQAFSYYINEKDPPYLAQRRARIKMEDEFTQEELDWFFSLYEQLEVQDVNNAGCAVLVKAILEKTPSPNRTGLVAR